MVERAAAQGFMLHSRVLLPLIINQAWSAWFPRLVKQPRWIAVVYLAEVTGWAVCFFLLSADSPPPTAEGGKPIHVRSVLEVRLSGVLKEFKYFFSSLDYTYLKRTLIFLYRIVLHKLALYIYARRGPYFSLWSPPKCSYSPIFQHHLWLHTTNHCC